MLVLLLQDGSVRVGAVGKQNEELAPVVEQARGDRQVVPVLVETLDEPWGFVAVGEAADEVLGRYPKTNGIVPSGTASGITSRPARRSGRYILRSRSWTPTGHCSTRAGA
ncbi:hypothetical protein ACFU8I_11785 [Streptomyces sp. NPDC057540]|uniref:hypothetical protein n=1 Tax=Streptomyces sp. NPDC057540 TaxID=3346160 RepID=UPI0036C0BCDB